MFLSKKEREHRILQGLGQSADALKARVGSTKTDGSALTLTAGETAIKKTYNNRFSIPLDFEFFKNHPLYPYGLQEDLYVTIQLNSPSKVMLVTSDADATYKISDLTLECDIIVDESYAETIASIYRNIDIPYTLITCNKHLSLSKKDTTWPISIFTNATNLRGILLLFKEPQTNFSNKNEQFYNPSIKKVMISVAGDTNQLYKGGILPRHVFNELKKYFYNNHSDIKDEDFLTTKYGLWIDFRSSQENALHGSGKENKGR